MADAVAVDTTKVRTHKAFSRIASGTVVKHGEMSQKTAEKVFLAFLREIDEEESTPEGREEILSLIAEALAYSTSDATDYSSVEFEYDGETETLASLEAAATRHYAGENPVRTWVRSFRNGEMAARISDLIATPENIELRNVIAARYDVNVADAHLCFDTSDGLFRTGRVYSYSERRIIDSAKAHATERARVRAVEKGDVRPVHDKGGRPSGEPNMGSAVSAPPESRAGFRSLRG